MIRREFITLLGGAAVAWPIVARRALQWSPEQISGWLKQQFPHRMERFAVRGRFSVSSRLALRSPI